MLEMSARLLGDCGRLRYVLADAIDIPHENRLGEDIRGEVAVGALRLAKGEGDVQAESHRDDYATAGISMGPAGISAKGLSRVRKRTSARPRQSRIHVGKASILSAGKYRASREICPSVLLPPQQNQFAEEDDI
jgi:hypothetical protein